MQLIRGFHNLAKHHTLANGCALTIGNFDGVHLGHLQVLTRLKSQAEKLGVPTVVMLFEPQPREFFAQQFGSLAPARLMRLRDKLHALQQVGVDYVLVVRFNHAFAQLSPEAFIQRLACQLNVRYVSVGDDFRFGAKRAGDFRLLAKAGKQFGFEVEDNQTHCFAEQRVSSSLIREALQADNFAQVAQLLGKKYTILGRVAHGNKLGRTIGFPTANIMLNRLVTPIQGVYAVQVQGAFGTLNGIANVGNRPTINGTKPLLEVHLFDFSQQIYGQTIEVIFLKKIRNEVKFPSFEALKEQIEQDVAAVRAFFAEK